MFAKFSQYFLSRRPVRMSTFLWVAALTAAADQITKLIMREIFHPNVQWVEGMPQLLSMGREIVLIPNVLQFSYRINTGAAFSALTGHTGFLTGISVVISLFVLAWAWWMKPAEQGQRLSLGLIFGGAIGNLIDRLWLGYVVDFIDAHWKDMYHWPTFNVADSAICVGIFLLAVASIFVAQPSADTPETATDSVKPVVTKKNPGTS